MCESSILRILKSKCLFPPETIVPRSYQTFHKRNLQSLPLKGQCHEISNFRFFSGISFPQVPEYTIKAISNFFSKIRCDIRSSRCTNCVVDTGGKWKQSSIIFLHLWIVELTQRYSLSFKFTFRCQQSDIAPSIGYQYQLHQRYRWQNVLPPVLLILVVLLDLQISPWIFDKIRNDPNVMFRAWGKMVHEKILKQKFCYTVPLTAAFKVHD